MRRKEVQQYFSGVRIPSHMVHGRVYNHGAARAAINERTAVPVVPWVLIRGVTTPDNGKNGLPLWNVEPVQVAKIQ